ncbi:hypothetical protein BD413DRAFT_577356 [Trametes elegans]|nr:hypothetical protein BD413DRAFT_577356 [Trametes elegans]
MYSRIPINPGPPMSCAQANTLNPSMDIPVGFLSRGSLILADALAAAVTWRETYRSLETYRALRALETTSRRPSLLWVMLQNGSVYFCALVSINVLQMVLEVYAMRAQGATGTYATAFIDPATYSVGSILNCRLLLDLRETTERLTGCSSEYGMVSSLSFGGVASGAPGSHSLGGPVLPPFAPNSVAANDCSLGTGTEMGRD